MSAVKAWFLAIGFRERVLLTLFCVLSLLVVGGLFAGRANAAWVKDSATLARLRQQQAVIDRQAAVEKLAADATAKLVPGASLTQNQLKGQVDQMAAAAGIRGNNYQSSTLPGDASTSSTLGLHAIRVNLTNVAWEPIRTFYSEILKRRPYIVIEDMTVTLSDPRTGLHSVQMKLSSIEVRQ